MIYKGVQWGHDPSALCSVHGYASKKFLNLGRLKGFSISILSNGSNFWKCLYFLAPPTWSRPKSCPLIQELVRHNTAAGRRVVPKIRRRCMSEHVWQFLPL